MDLFENLLAGSCLGKCKLDRQFCLALQFV
jgi:hypothetical protein